MTHELIVGLEISDPESYQQYRTAMTPLLAAAGGGFRYDFEIAQTLRSEAAHPITRLFAIYFNDRESMNTFFTDPAYLQFKAQYFERAVRNTTILAAYDR